MKIRDMKLRTRLLGGFVIVLLLAALVGLCGVQGMSSIDAADHYLYTKMTEPMGDLVTITESFQRMRIGLRDAMDAASAADRDVALAEAKARSDEVDKAAATFEKTIVSVNGRKIFADFLAARDRYKIDFDKIMQLHNAGNKAGVAAMMAGEGKQAALAEQATIDALVAAKIALARDAADGNDLVARRSSLLMIGAVLAAIVLGVLLALINTKAITRSIGGEPAKIAAIADKVASGDLSIELGDARKMTGIQRSLAGMVESLKAKSAALKRIAGGDLSITVELASDRDEVGISMRSMLVSLNELLSQVALSVEQVAAGTEQVSQTAEVLSQGATEQASSIEEISASLLEISGQTKQNTSSALQVNDFAKASRDRAAEGNGRMKELVVAMGDINRCSEDIKKIVKAIDDIAFQINLLALNANVEAARAGKYGKGFAVVADEVRNLAVRSADAVKETTRMVEGSIASIVRGNELTRLTAAQLEQIAEGSAKVSELAQEVAAASSEQSRGIDQINAGVEQIDKVTQSNSSSAEESAAASEELASQAQALRSMVSRFTLRRIEATRAPSVSELSPELIERLLKELRGRPEIAAARQAPPLRSTSAIRVASEAEDYEDDSFQEF